VILVGKLKSFGPKPFKFFKNAEFMDWVDEGWKLSVEGVPMFQLYAKLKSIKQVLKKKMLSIME
jgi:hypothetical protein